MPPHCIHYEHRLSSASIVAIQGANEGDPNPLSPKPLEYHNEFHNGRTFNGKRAEYCFEKNVFRRRELTEFCGRLGEFCEKLGEFAFAHK